MITNIMPKGKLGTLKVPAKFIGKKMGESCALVFNVDSLFDWYPLDTRYTYRYDEYLDIIYLFLDDKNSLVPKYGLSHNKVDMLDKPHIKKERESNTFTWYNQVVKEDNDRVIEFATKLGMVSPKESYSIKDVNANLDIFQKALDELFNIAFEQFLKHDTLEWSTDDDSEYKLYEPTFSKDISVTNEEARAAAILSDIDDEQKELYIKLGEVYTMITLMRKVAVARG